MEPKEAGAVEAGTVEAGALEAGAVEGGAVEAGAMEPKEEGVGGAEKEHSPIGVVPA